MVLAFASVANSQGYTITWLVAGKNISTGYLPKFAFLKNERQPHRNPRRPACPKNLLDEAMDTPNGALVRCCFRILNAKNIGLTSTLADITEEEFRVLELIEAERQEQINCSRNGSERSR